MQDSINTVTLKQETQDLLPTIDRPRRRNISRDASILLPYILSFSATSRVGELEVEREVEKVVVVVKRMGGLVSAGVLNQSDYFFNRHAKFLRRLLCTLTGENSFSTRLHGGISRTKKLVRVDDYINANLSKFRFCHLRVG